MNFIRMTCEPGVNVTESGPMPDGLYIGRMGNEGGGSGCPEDGRERDMEK